MLPPGTKRTRKRVLQLQKTLSGNSVTLAGIFQKFQNNFKNLAVLTPQDF